MMHHVVFVIVAFLALGVSSQLSTNCYDWPAKEFTPSDNAGGEYLFIHAGDRAPDFTLSDVNGKKYTLSELLKEKPVVVQFGSYTCPVFQRKVEESKVLAKDFPQVTFLVIYNIEAHPKTDVSPYSGKPWELQYSIYKQAYTYPDRVKHAIANTELWNGFGSQILLIDDLEPNGPNNPLWCTYGTAPNGGWLIRQDSIVDFEQYWFGVDDFRKAIQRLISA
mmetsp:Transcript_21856/g.24398  ORF Transcript_21856/g.24398 Transcript_21856/m.24398 type:complete len:221 (-) Transcript_21856:87-749(-)